LKFIIKNILSGTEVRNRNSGVWCGGARCGTGL